MAVDIPAYKSGITTDIENAVADSSISEDRIAQGFKDLADIVAAVIGGAITADYDTLLKVANKIAALEGIVGNADPDGDSLVNKVAEIMSVFATYPEGTDIYNLIQAKLTTSNIINNLTTTTGTNALDARQGKILNDLILLRPLTTYVDSQDAAITSLITALKAGSTETILSLNNKITAINAIVGGSTADGDAIVNTVAELLAIFATYPEGVDMLTLVGSKINVTDIVNNLTTAAGVPGKVLDARQGKILSDAIAAINLSLSNKADLSSGKILVSQLPDTIPLANLEEDELTDHLNPEHFESYDTGLDDTDGNSIFKVRSTPRILYPSRLCDLLSDMAVGTGGDESNFAPFHIAKDTCALSTGDTKGTWVYVRKARTISRVRYVIKTQGVFANPVAGTPYNGFTLHKVDGSALGALVAETANDYTIWSAVAGLKTMNFVTPYVAEPGWYLVSARFDATSGLTTAPGLAGYNFGTTNMAIIDGLRLNFNIATNRPATINMKTVTGAGLANIWFEI